MVKRWSVMYTCLSGRAVHIESVNHIDTNSFIMSLRRFICRRGIVRLLRSDNGTNFVGSQNELKEMFLSLDHSKVKSFLRSSENCDWVAWKRNPPYGSHFGGVWEREIRSTRAILNGILLNQSKSLNDGSFRTFFCEIECILNSRPLTVENISDPLSLQPISPLMLLTMKTKIVPTLPRNFDIG